MVGYYKDAETTNSIMKNGYIQTEDLSYVDEDGMICLLGRQGDVIISGGNKIAPGEIEDVAGNKISIILLSCPNSLSRALYTKVSV